MRMTNEFILFCIYLIIHNNKCLFYFRREREGSKLEYYYNEFVKRDWYKDKNLYDNRGRRIHYDINGNEYNYFQQIHHSCKLYLNLKQHISNIVGISGKRKNGPMKYSSVKISEEMDMTPNVFENRSVKELIRGKFVKLVEIVYQVKR